MSCIELEGARVHNLRGIQLAIPHHRVTVICGVSGSGKSSLAFDTLFAEGQRRYVETFSPQARQFLDQLERPDVDRIDGIPPSVAIRQQRRLTSPWTTVGSRTDILSYLQLLFAQAGVSHCPGCDRVVRAWGPQAVTSELLQVVPGRRAMIGFTVDPKSGINTWIKAGFSRGLIDGHLQRLESWPVDRLPDSLQVMIDRVSLEADAEGRITEAVQTAFECTSMCTVLVKTTDGPHEIDGDQWATLRFSSTHYCPDCDLAIPPLSQDLLSFQSAVGACGTCQGSGQADGAAGTSCSDCNGTRLNAAARAVRLLDHNLPSVLARECDELPDWLEQVEDGMSKAAARGLSTVRKQLKQRLAMILELGLGYLSLDRTLMTLSGGEARRVVLTSVLGSGLTNTLYVLDEPTSGMHEGDIERVVRAIRGLQTSGNTVVVVEHDPQVIQSADYVVELGPRAGHDGGDVVFSGSVDDLMNADTVTGQALRADGRTDDAASGVTSPVTVNSDHWLRLRGIHCHNLQGVAVDLPLQQLCAVTGPSGSGKSSLIVNALYPTLLQAVGNEDASGRPPCEIVAGVERLKGVQLLEQNPLQRSSRSVPVTYLGAFDDIRRLLAETHESRKRQFTPGTFSFNSTRGGRCERCLGVGSVTIDMQFLADVESTCDQCQGRRFRADVLDIRYRDRAVDEILDMTAEQAFLFFNGHQRIQRALNALRQAGLGYLTLGQPLSTLSGGESQRLRIAALLAGVPVAEAPDVNVATPVVRQEFGTLFLLDEPSTGLHLADCDHLMNCLRQLVQVGHSVIIIEHDARLVRQCDYRIEMGPGPGRQGGQIVRQGPVDA